MLDIAVAFNKYSFLGYEFLTWLWFLTENAPDRIREIYTDTTTLTVGNRVVLENRVHDGVESITIKGDDAGLEEGRLAIRKGAVVTELNLIYKSGENEWRFTLKGESFHIANLKLPETGPVETGSDIEGVVLERIYLSEKIVRLIDALYVRFVKLRLSEDWQKTAVPELNAWSQ